MTRTECLTTIFSFLLIINATANTFLATSKVDSRIVGGQPIYIDSAPWQVSVRLIALETEMYGFGHICGGAVISQRVVVTAAHCTLNEYTHPVTLRTASEYTLVMGSTYLTTTSYYTLQYEVLQIIVDADFNLNTLSNDIALFLINGYIPWNWPTVSAIPLNRLAEPYGTICSVTGWGSTGLNSLSNVLMQAIVPIVDYNTCDTNYGNLSLGMLCAGYMKTGGIDACQGDSGGPLVCNGMLVGIVSWGQYCALAGYPGVYTNISHYYNWLVTNNNSFNYSYYESNRSNKNKVFFLYYLMTLGILVLRKIFSTNIYQK